MITLSIEKCKNHESFAIIINDADEGIGTRLTPFKCCGHWDTVKSYKMTIKQLRDIAKTFLNYAGIEEKR